MLVNVAHLAKSFGNKDLYEDLQFTIEEGEKVGVVGRNGLGKSSLLRILDGEDKDYRGTVEIRKGTRIIMTRQEHHDVQHMTPIEYILADVPDFSDMERILFEYEQSGEEKVSLEAYCDTVNSFSERGFYELRGKVVQSLKNFQIGEDRQSLHLEKLSGGEKRFVEMVRIMYAEVDLALIDEPTNHMDYVGKEQFITWLNQSKETMIIVTHDRDVLKHVDRILELKASGIHSYKGNYDAYLKQNSMRTVTSMQDYEQKQKRIAELKKQIETHRGSDPKLRIMRERFQRELKVIMDELDKPAIWIDRESLDQVSDKVVERYEKYKDKNIAISYTNHSQHKKKLMEVKNLALGYGDILFSGVGFELFYGDRIRIKGRNGAGKSTLIKTILQHTGQKDSSAQILEGSIEIVNHLKVGYYEQEVGEKFLKMTLEEALTQLYFDADIPVNSGKITGIMKQYLFDPITDRNLEMQYLSGGQKARFQLISMFLTQPNLLILDEPTNHLDLPSIEELENALLRFNGAILYVTHDSYFSERIGGREIQIGE